MSDRAPLIRLTDADAASLMVSLLNSSVLDYAARSAIGGTDLSYFILKQLPALPPSVFLSNVYQGLTYVDYILPRVLELTYTAWDMEPFAHDCGFDGPPFRWDEARRFLLRAELDAAFFRLYLPADADGNWQQAEHETADELARLEDAFATPRDAVAYIMDTFPIVKRKDEGKYDGDYRTKRVIIEVYDALAAAIRSGQPYQTRLTPPPGDRSLCHPARARQ